jgi:asparagine synthase (glutamine-hydrolysing)
MGKKNNIFIKELYGWKLHKIDQFDVWFNGYVHNETVISFLKKGVALLSNDFSNLIDFDNLFRNTSGHFSLVVSNSKKLLCCVDHVRSIPLFYSFNESELLVGSYAPDIIKNINKRSFKYNHQAAIEIAMSGYTIGRKTLHPNIFQICAGELLISRNHDFNIRKYYQYSPWKFNKRPKVKLKKDLTEVSLLALEKMLKTTADRQIVIPLSAGNDSRFIVSGLKQLGAKNVLCFSYGLHHNFEVETAKKVADHLNYPWYFIPLSIKKQKKIFSNNVFIDFWKYSDTLSNQPILIDFSAVKLLKESGKISKDAIFVNGNAGDFISGGHIDPQLLINNNNLDSQQLIKSIITKHYSLWRCLKTQENIGYISQELELFINKLINNNNLSWTNFAEIGESMEWYGRQSKIVTTTQRSYEYFNFEWRLPMWDLDFINFWEGVETKYKINQALYVETMLENNWGGVWENIAVNDYSIASKKLRVLRNFSKIFFVLFDKKVWNRFDNKYFSYFYDDTAASAIVPYNEVFFNKCGPRNRNSWIAQKYLLEKDIDIIDRKVE